MTLVLVTLMSSLVSPISEEIAFRGYCQQILEGQFSGLTAVILSSTLFMLAHTNHGLYWTKLSVYFLAGLTFGAVALLTNSILTTLPVHIVADVTFFVFVWPNDAGRVLIPRAGPTGGFGFTFHRPCYLARSPCLVSAGWQNYGLAQLA